MLAGGQTLLGAPHRVPVMIAEANRKPTKHCLSKGAADFGYRWAVTQPVHSGGVLGDINWILVAQNSQRAGHRTSRPASSAVNIPALGADDAPCSWANGCCARHPGLEACKHNTNSPRGNRG